MLASLAVARYDFFGKETISFLVILPIALPGIITGLALQATILNVLSPLGISFSIWTIIIGHATFCIVVVYNNAVARLRRVSGSLEEASADLGAGAWQTFRYVTFPQMRTALLAGGLLAFALSFDEVIVTVFTSGAQKTLPIWMLDELRPAEGTAHRERRRLVRDRRLDHPRLDRPAPDAGGDRRRGHAGSSRRCAAVR